MITVRDALPSDLDALIRFNKEMAWQTEQKVLDPESLRSGIRHLLENPSEGRYLVAQNAEGIAGALMLTFEWSDWRNGRFWWIQSVYVVPESRRQGVYTALHAKATQIAMQDPQACGLRLYVETENKVAQVTYQHLGMTETHYRLYEVCFDRARNT